jgi:hypothetical protein
MLAMLDITCKDFLLIPGVKQAVVAIESNQSARFSQGERAALAHKLTLFNFQMLLGPQLSRSPPGNGELECRCGVNERKEAQSSPRQLPSGVTETTDNVPFYYCPPNATLALIHAKISSSTTQRHT